MPSRIKLAEPFMDEVEWHAMRESIESGWLTQGPKVAEFERQFARRHEATHAIATSSCTTALHLILAAHGIGPGDEVIVPSFTWVATANAVMYCGATPVLVDISLDTFNVDAPAVKSAVTKQTRAVVAVHLFGLCADIDAIRSAVPEGVLVVEDAACAAGARFRGRSAGTLGDAAAFSFHPRKVLTTGEGGMVTTEDAALAEQIKILRNHGASAATSEPNTAPLQHAMPIFDRLGYNYRMTDLQGAMGIVQLGRLDQFIDHRDELASRYTERLQDFPSLTAPRFDSAEREHGDVHAWQAYVVIVHEDAAVSRDRAIDELAERGIETRPGTHAVHELDFYRARWGYGPHDLPQAHAAAQRSIALPLHNRMTADDVDRVVDAMQQTMKGPHR